MSATKQAQNRRLRLASESAGSAAGGSVVMRAGGGGAVRAGGGGPNRAEVGEVDRNRGMRHDGPYPPPRPADKRCRGVSPVPPPPA